MEAKERMESYTELFQEVKARVGDDAAAIAIVEQIGKDARVEKMYGGVSSSRGLSGGDRPATEKQLGFLRGLGVTVDAGLTKKEASRLIDEAQARVIAA